VKKLYISEGGHVAPFSGEDISSRKWIRKKFLLDSDPGELDTVVLYLFVHSYPHNEAPLKISVNESYEIEIDPDTAANLHWIRQPLPAETLVSGENLVTLKTDSPAQAAWTIGLEERYPNPDSTVSFDHGKSWTHNRMGRTNRTAGEYVIRLFTEKSGSDHPENPEFVWENPHSPYLAELVRIIPETIRSCPERSTQINLLREWISGSWKYSNSSMGIIYTPWDPWTIMQWGQREVGQGGLKPVCMCVHYAVLFTECCLALGIPSRNIVTAESLLTGNGHFISEVWRENPGKWAAVDPQGDLVFEDHGIELSMYEVWQKGKTLGEYILEGKNTAGHRAQLGDLWFDRLLGEGRPFRMWGVWQRNDYLTSPWKTPPGHGQVGYCETDIHWYEECALQEDLNMFPYILSYREYSSGPPEQWLKAGKVKQND
jgi:hypothetical protein